MIARRVRARIDKLEDGFFADDIFGVGLPFDKVGDNTVFLSRWYGYALPENVRTAAQPLRKP